MSAHRATVSAATGALTSTASYTSVVLSDNPSVYYRLDETSGTTADDSSGHGITATYQPSVTLGVTGAITGDTDTAVQTSGGHPIIQAPSSSLPAGSAARTVEAWVRLKAGQNAMLVSYYPGLGWNGDNGYLGVNLQASGPSIVHTAFGSGLDDGNWHQVGWTFDGSTITLFADGVVVDTAAASFTEVSESFWADSSDALDEVAVYPTALSPARIAARSH